MWRTDRGLGIGSVETDIPRSDALGRALDGELDA